MRRFGQWETSGACYPSQIPIITNRRNVLVTAYNAAREKIIESNDNNLATQFNNAKNQVDVFHNQQVSRWPCPWADPSPWGHKYTYYANQFNNLRIKAVNAIAQQKQQEAKNQPKPTTPTPTTPSPSPTTPTPAPTPQAPPKPKPPPPCKPAPCGTPPYNMKCKVPGRGSTNPICKCGKWVCPGGPSWEKVEEMKKKGGGGISPYMSQAYGIKRYVAPKPKPKTGEKPKAEGKPKAAGLGDYLNIDNKTFFRLAAAAFTIGAFLYYRS